MLWRRSAGKTRHREIRRAPEEMHRAAFADEAPAKHAEDAVRLDEKAPKAVCVLAVVSTMHLVLIERNRIGDLVRLAIERDVQPELREGIGKSLVEERYRLRLQREAADRTFARLDAQRMLDEIEFDLERARTVRYR
jgi:hypothetical protein